MPDSPLRGALPGYAFDLRMAGGRYRHVLPNGSLGRLVSRDAIVGLLRTVSDASGERFAGLARAAVEGRISASELFRVMQGELKDLHNSAAALARGGWNQVDNATWGRNGQVLRGEYAFLSGFCQDIADGKLTVAQAEARARLYSGRGYSRFFAEDARLKMASGRFTEELWEDTRGPNECQTCAERAKLGWVPIGSIGAVPGDGSSECLGNCRCTLSHR